MKRSGRGRLARQRRSGRTVAMWRGSGGVAQWRRLVVVRVCVALQAERRIVGSGVDNCACVGLPPAEWDKGRKPK